MLFPSARLVSTRAAHAERGFDVRWLLAAPLIALATSACRSEVSFYEKAAFADPVMDMADEARETHWYAKVYFSLEGSIGGIGTSGGGGCGCY